MNLLLVNGHLSGAAVAAIIIAFVIPFVSSLIKQEHWDDTWTGIISVVLSAANGFFTEWAHSHSAFHWRAALVTAATSLVYVLLTRYVLLKGTPLDRRLLAVGGSKAGKPAV